MKTLPVLRKHADDTAVERRDDGDRGPFAELEQLTRRLSADVWWPFDDVRDVFRPLADVEELDDAFVVEIELPGIRREDVDIELSGRELTVSGVRKEKERVGILRRRERTTGRFQYAVWLPGDVDDEHVDATLDEGVLKLRLAKPERDRPRRITVG